jgi:hypothetical protein
MLGITTSGILFHGTDIVSDLKKNNISLIDCSITNLTSKNWQQITDSDIQELSDRLEKNLIKINSIQSIFYNKNYNFSNDLDLKYIINHLQILCKYAKILKCKKLLFGSPKQREDVGNFTNFIKTFKVINSLMNENDMIFNIENLQNQKNVLLKETIDIVDFIETNDLKNCKVNLHLFIEDENSNLSINDSIDTIHFSDYNYTDSILNENFHLLKKLIHKTEHIKNNKLLEFNTQKINNLFDLFK